MKQPGIHTRHDGFLSNLQQMFSTSFRACDCQGKQLPAGPESSRVLPAGAAASNASPTALATAVTSKELLRSATAAE